jgi:ketosteroid isomerase-like protein
MSQANVEIARRGVDAFNRRDLSTHDALCTPDFEWLPAFPGVVESGAYRGREGVETYYREVGETWEEYRVIANEFRDLGDRVLLLGRLQGRGKGSGVPVDAPMGMVFEFRGGRCSRHRVYLDPGEALRAAGLCGESQTPDLVDLVRLIFGAAGSRDWNAVLSLCAADVVWEAVSLGTSFAGVPAICGFLEDWLGAYEEFEMEPEEIVDLGNGVVFVVTRLSGRPVGSSGSALKRRRPLVFLWVERLVARVTAPSSDIAEARAAAERLAESRG